MSVFVIVQGKVTDAQQYEQYKAAAAPTVVNAGGRYVVRGGDTVALEGGEVPERTVVLQFDDREAALAWYHSHEYQAVRALREHAAELRLYVVDGA